MSLQALVQAMDEPALIAASSKGLVLRARKDVEAGRVHSLDPGTVQVGDDHVSLSEKSLDAATCTCTATGICRHILAAILFLQASETGPDAAAPTVPSDPFDLEEIERFAGADWPRALAHVENGTLEDQPGTVRVTFAETREQVAFPAGQPLKQALYKGPRDSRRRLAVAAAALLWARDRGADLPEIVDQSAGGPMADPATLADARAAIEAAAVALAAGTLDAARERLFSAAISTRAEAIPRLAAEMRGLSRRMDADALRRADETPVSLLMGLARSHALSLALATHPSDLDLTGTLGRSFDAAGPREIGFLGASAWHNPSGAKGFTAAFADLNTGAIYRAVQARAAGTDLAFRPEDCWNTPLWTLAKPKQLAARRIHLPDAALSHDGALGLSQKADWASGAFALGDLLQCGAATRDFSTLGAVIDAQIGVGLRRRAGEALIVVVPKTVHPAVHDEHEQKIVWQWEDAAGTALPITLAGDGAYAERLSRFVRKVRGALVSCDPSARDARLISLWLDEDPARSMQFETLPTLGKFETLVDTITNRAKISLGLGRAPLSDQSDPLRRLLDRCIEGVLVGLVAKPGLSANLLRDLDALGLSSLAQINTTWTKTGSSRDALRLGYALALGHAQLDDAQ